MPRSPRRIRAMLASVILATTALFVAAVVIERSGPVEKARTGTEEKHSEKPPPHLEEEGEGSENAAPHGETGEEGERLVGVDLKSPALVALAVVLSIGMAVAVLFADKRGLLIAVAVTMLAFALLDIRELVHQMRESRPGLAVLAAAVALGHLGADALSVRAAARREAVV